MAQPVPASVVIIREMAGGIQSPIDDRQPQTRAQDSVTVHSVEQKSIGVIFRTFRSGSDVRYSCHHNLSPLYSPYLCMRGVSLSSIH